MRYIFILALLAGGLAAQPLERSTDSLDRQNLLDRAAQDVRDLRQQVDAAAGGATQVEEARYRPIYDAVSLAESALAAYRIASETDRTSAWIRFEAAQQQAVLLWESTRTKTEVSPAAP